MQSFNYILILLISSVVFIGIFRRLELPTVLGYLCAGIVVGPGGLALFPSSDSVHFLAEFGIVFLMFTLGLEFSIPRLISNKRALVGIGGTQVGVCTIFGATVAYFFDFNMAQSIILGGGLALSSTAVVIKQLSEQKEQHTGHGNMAINILLFQDLAAVFFLILVPALSTGNEGNIYQTFSLTIAKGVLVTILMALSGIWVLRPIFHQVAKAHSTELFMMATLLVALSAAWVTHELKLSMALGAFLAGLMLGETEFKHQIELDIRPFRDVLLGLFFVVIGAYLELKSLPQIWSQVALLLLVLMLIKTLVIFLVTKIVGKTSNESAFRVGIILGHGGEFGFVILSEAMNHGLISTHERPIIFTTLVISMLCTPLIIKNNDKICKFFFKKYKYKDKVKEYPSYKLDEHAAELKDHVIICGYGRVGQILTRFLEQEDIEWLALDLDPMRISKAAIAGEHSFYGDATYPGTLTAAGLSRARMVVIAFSNEDTTLAVLKQVRSMRLDVPVFVRTRDDSSLELFQEAGATEVVPESLEASIMLASHLLLTLGVPSNKIMDKVRRIHNDRYEILRGLYSGSGDNTSLEDQKGLRRSLHSIYIPQNSYIIGKNLSELLDSADNDLINDKQTFIKYITREGVKINKPSANIVLQAEDVIVLFATPEESLVIEEKILNG